ncbi:MAG: hypothetical protein NTX14_03625 [Candidatus Nealsonbacteria bacterium]|nr:hypothetical protein [Candidatus Nealsonbacteria bacterium]
MDRYGFVPKWLEFPDRPELAVFPLNILFMSYARIDGVLNCGTALYEPLIDTYVDDGARVSLMYLNSHNHDPEKIWSIKIIYDRGKNLYTGLKFRNADLITESVHRDWYLFFGVWTMGGLSNGESCKFDAL